MGNTEQTSIRFVVDDEQMLYTTFSPENEFTDAVKKYIRSKIAVKDNRHSISLTVMSRNPLNEERFRSAVSNWIRDEEALFQKEGKELIRMLVGRLALGSILILLSLTLQQKYEVLKYSLIPVMSSLALSKAASILIVELPLNAKYKKILKMMEEKNAITFEYGYAQNVGNGTPSDANQAAPVDA